MITGHSRNKWNLMQDWMLFIKKGLEMDAIYTMGWRVASTVMGLQETTQSIGIL